VDGALLPKTLIDGGSGLNIIFTDTLKKMKFEFSRMTACDEPFYGIVLGKATYPLGQVSLSVTFGTVKNLRTEYLIFEVVDFKSLYHAILGRPMLARFMAIPHYTYLVPKMLVPNGVLFVYSDILAVDLASTHAYSVAASALVAKAKTLNPADLMAPEQNRTSPSINANPTISRNQLG
jgi:hypothetical protein